MDSSAPFQPHHYLNKATSEYDIKRFKQSHVVLQKNDWLSPPLLIITGHSLDQCCQHSAQVWILEWCHCSHKHGTGCPSQAGSQPLHHGQSLCSKGKFVSETITWNMFFLKIQNKWMKINWKQNTFAECFSYEIHIWNSHCWTALEMIFIPIVSKISACTGWENYADY